VLREDLEQPQVSISMKPNAIAGDLCRDLLDQPIVGCRILFRGQHVVDHIEGANIKANQDHEVVPMVFEPCAVPGVPAGTFRL
jgi:hypothetical protein